MRFLYLLFFLFSNLVYAQDPQPVATDDAVITLTGFCAEPARPDVSCKTVITRAQFEQISNALQPDLSLAQRLKVANAYARNLRMAAVAEQRGIDKTSQFEEQMRYARLQLLAQDLDQTLQADAHNISDAEVEENYRGNQTMFETAVFERIIIPPVRNRPDANEMAAQLASETRVRVINGENADKLQREVYAQIEVPLSSANTRLENVRRSSLPPSHEVVMTLKPGEVSDIISDPAGAHFIYKMLEKRTLPLEEVKVEILKTISTQRYRDSMKAFQGDAVFSDAYFNPPSAHAISEQRNRAGKIQEFTEK